MYPLKTIKVGKKNYLLFGIPFLILGCLFIYFSINSFIATKKFINRAIHTTGTVIDLEVCKSEKSPPTVRPIIVFTDINGKFIRLDSLICESPPRFALGETADLLYVLNNPSKALVNKNDYLYLPTFIYGFFTYVFLFFAFFILGLRGKSSTSGMPAAIIIGGNFILYGLVFLFMGSPLFSDRVIFTILGIPFVLFGITIIVWEKYKSSRNYNQPVKK